MRGENRVGANLLSEGMTMRRRGLAAAAGILALLTGTSTTKADDIIRLGGPNVDAKTMTLGFDGQAVTELMRGGGGGGRGGGGGGFHGGGFHGGGFRGGFVGVGGFRGGFVGGRGFVGVNRGFVGVNRGFVG